jgi:hypothetical protein
MRWTEEDVALNAMYRVTAFRVEGLSDPAGYLSLPYILNLAEVYENYAVAVGYYWSSSQPLQWQESMRAEGFARLKKLGYYFGRNPDVLFECDFILKLAWALRGHTDRIGTKRANEAGLLMSAFEGKAEVGLRDRQDRF